MPSLSLNVGLNNGRKLPFGGFNPISIYGLQLWLDATKGLFDATSGGNPVTADGSSVARWEDQSGSGYHVTQSTSANRPVLKTGIRNSKNAIRFDGSGDKMVSPSIPQNDSSGLSVFVVMYVNGYGGGGFGRIFVRGAVRRYFVAGGAVQRSEFQVVQLNTHTSATGSIQTGSWYLNAGLWNGGTSASTSLKQRINRTESGSAPAGIANISSSLNQAYTIGDEVAGGRGFDGDFAELIIYNQALTTEQIDNVEGYLAAKWGF